MPETFDFATHPFHPICYLQNGAMYKELDFIGYPGYRVDSRGGLWTRKHRGIGGWRIGDEWKPMKPSANSDGYHCLYLSNDGIKGLFTVHKLVLLGFIGACPDGMECCHGNNIRIDNRLENLRWDTQVANQADRIIHGTAIRGEKHKRAVLTDAIAKAIHSDYSTGNYTRNRLAKKYDVSYLAVKEFLSGRSWQHLNLPPLKWIRKGGAKLNASEVKEIRRLREENNYTHQQLANMFLVARRTITSILSGKNWSSLP